MAKDACAGVGDIRGSGSPGQEDPLEEGPAAHSRVLAWSTPWTEQPGGRATAHRVSQSWTQLK